MVRHLILAVAFSLALPSLARAVPTHYQISGGTVTGNLSDPGLVINTSLSPGLAGTSFTLNDGGSSTFNFFDVWTNESFVNPDDLIAMSISATLYFSDPVTGVTVDGLTFGGSVLFGLAQFGQVQWNGPTTVTLGDRVFSVALSDQIFNFGLFGLSEGEGYGATISATVTQLSSNTVPDTGSTAALFGVGLVALGLFSRKTVGGLNRIPVREICSAYRAR